MTRLTRIDFYGGPADGSHKFARTREVIRRPPLECELVVPQDNVDPLDWVHERHIYRFCASKRGALVYRHAEKLKGDSCAPG